MANKHYLVTGGAGFIGSHLVDQLLADDDAVTVIDDLSTGFRLQVPEAAHFIRADCGDPTHLDAILPEIDGIFHLAAIALVQKTTQEWTKSSQVNSLATIQILEAVVRSQRKVPVVFASSAAVYGDASDSPITEATLTSPLTPYGADKLASELHLKVASHLFAIPTMALRFFNVYGPRQDPSSPYSGVISIFCDRAKHHQPITIFGDGTQTRDFVHVFDVVAHLSAAMRLLQSSQTATPAINVCTSHATSIKELASTLISLTGSSSQIQFEASRSGDIVHSLGDATLAKHSFGLDERISIEKGLQTLLLP